MVINIPPLRERKGDIIQIAEYFIEENRKNFGSAIKGFSEEAKDILIEYQWPGNVRELKNTVERAMLIADSGEIKKEHLPEELRNSLPAHYGKNTSNNEELSGVLDTLKDIERRHILNVWEKVVGNKTKAAKILGISRLTLREKLKKYGIEI